MLGFLPVIFAFIISFFSPMFIGRYMLFACLGLFMAVAYAFSLLPLQNWLKYVFLLLYTCFAFTQINIGSFANENWKAAMPFFKQYKDSNTITFLIPTYQEGTFAYHYKKQYFEDYKHVRKHLSEEKIYSIDRGEFIPGVIEKQDPEKVILVQSQYKITDPENTAKQALEKYFRQTAITDHLGVRITVYEK